MIQLRPQTFAVELAHDPDILIQVFDGLFAGTYRTRLRGGAAEPVYRPAAHDAAHHEVVFTRDYFASALHEVAHWCIAGPTRRQQLDYGYWYAPDGRSAEQQRVFETVEVTPQALEWVFSRAAAYRFRLSADNLEAGAGPSEAFRRAVWEQARAYCRSGLPERAARFAGALAQRYGSDDVFEATRYRLEDI